jgi:hypothetical protein
VVVCCVTRAPPHAQSSGEGIASALPDAARPSAETAAVVVMSFEMVRVAMVASLGLPFGRRTSESLERYECEEDR